jgi:hypothetical protein
LKVKRLLDHEDREQLLMKKLHGHQYQEQQMCYTYWKNVRQQLIVLEICLENFSEAFTEGTASTILDQPASSWIHRQLESPEEINTQDGHLDFSLQ